MRRGSPIRFVHKLPIVKSQVPTKPLLLPLLVSFFFHFNPFPPPLLLHFIPCLYIAIKRYLQTTTSSCHIPNSPLVMKSPIFPLSFLFLLSILAAGIDASAEVDGWRHHHHHHHQRPYSFGATKLFVFGDSYADTGNIPRSLASSWKQPYGITFPGKPAGRFSDGRILTDYVAKFYGLKSPIPYSLMKYAGKKVKYGVNFAYGGTGVFDTLGLLPNMTTQIDFFEKLLNKSVYTPFDLQSSLFLLTVAGNDYGAYTLKGGSDQGLVAFIPKVVNQIAENLKRLHGLGARKISVTALPPLGCLPRSTVVSSFQQCNTTQNAAVGFHNLLLSQAVAKLNNETKDSSFAIIDLFTSFTTVLQNKSDLPGSLRFDTPLKPCCMATSSGYFCGSLNDKGEKMYSVCEDTESAFFWDNVHPTQAGWYAVFNGALKSTLEQLH